MATFNEKAADSGVGYQDWISKLFGIGGAAGGGTGTGKAGGGVGAAAGLVAAAGAGAAGSYIASEKANGKRKETLENLGYKDLINGLKNGTTEQAIEELKKGETTTKPQTGIVSKNEVADVGNVVPGKPTTTIPGTTTIPSIQDKTDENVEQSILGSDYNTVLQFIKDQQKEQWAREDSIRKETQEREDTAYQRAVDDMQKAGINPNLMNVNPAESGGGISNATGMDYSMWQSEVNKQVALLEEIMQEEFKEDENTKDRFSSIFGSLLSLFVLKSIK